jgi:hypothetical protein
VLPSPDIAAAEGPGGCQGRLPRGHTVNFHTNNLAHEKIEKIVGKLFTAASIKRSYLVSPSATDFKINSAKYAFVELVASSKGTLVIRSSSTVLMMAISSGLYADMKLSQWRFDVPPHQKDHRSLCWKWD